MCLGNLDWNYYINEQENRQAIHELFGHGNLNANMLCVLFFGLIIHRGKNLIEFGAGILAQVAHLLRCQGEARLGQDKQVDVAPDGHGWRINWARIVWRKDGSASRPMLALVR